MAYFFWIEYPAYLYYVFKRGINRREFFRERKANEVQEKKKRMGTFVSWSDTVSPKVVRMVFI